MINMIFLMTILFLFAKRIYAPFSLFSMNGSIVSDPYSDMFQNTLLMYREKYRLLTPRKFREGPHLIPLRRHNEVPHLKLHRE